MPFASQSSKRKHGKDKEVGTVTTDAVISASYNTDSTYITEEPTQLESDERTANSSKNSCECETCHFAFGCI